MVGRFQASTQSDSASPDPLFQDPLCQTDAQTREQLLLEVQALRQRVAHLEAEAHAHLEQNALETRFAQVFQASPDGMAIITLTEGRVIDINESFLKVLGYPCEDVLGRPLPGFAGMADPLRLPTAVQNLECSVYSYSGDVKTLLLSAESIEFDGQNHWLISAKDITDRKQTERALQDAITYGQRAIEREQALNQIIQDIRHSLDLNTVFATTTSAIGRLLNVDRVEIVQYVPEQAVWLNVASYCRSDLPSALGLRIPDRDNQFAARLKRGEVVQTHTDRAVDAINAVYAQSYPGSWLLVPLSVSDEIWGSLSLNYHHPLQQWQPWEIDLACAVADQLGIAIQQSQLYIEIQELNEHLEGQVRLRTAQFRQALKFEALLKRITDRVRDSLDEAQILQVAVRELAQGLGLLGCDAALYDLEQQISTICFEEIRAVLPPAKGQPINMSVLPDLYEQLLQGRPIQFCQLQQQERYVRPSAHRFAILACPMIDNRQVIGDIWLFRSPHAGFNNLEIRLVQQVATQCAIALRQSHLYQAAQAQVQELERLNQLKDDFLSTVSHELRTPMASIRMATQMLETLLFEDAPVHAEFSRVQRYFQILRDECDREIRLINDLLDLSRLDAETEPLLLTTIDPRMWIAHIAEPFIALARSQQQVLELHIEPLPDLTTDLAALERILSELLNNACKYSPPEAQIVVTADIQPNIPAPLAPDVCMLALRVTNTGVEIPDEEQTLVFEKFYRIPNNDPWKYSGIGLGLALVKKLVHRLQGKITVQSGQNQTTFTVLLPLQYADRDQGVVGHR